MPFRMSKPLPPLARMAPQELAGAGMPRWQRLHLRKPAGQLPLNQLCNLILEVLIHVVKQN